MASEKAVTHSRAISTCAYSQVSHTSHASSSPDKQLRTKADTLLPAPKALIPYMPAKQTAAVTRKGYGRGGTLQFKIMLTSCIQILT